MYAVITSSVTFPLRQQKHPRAYGGGTQNVRRRCAHSASRWCVVLSLLTVTAVTLSRQRTMFAITREVFASIDNLQDKLASGMAAQPLLVRLACLRQP